MKMTVTITPTWTKTCEFKGTAPTLNAAKQAVRRAMKKVGMI